MSWMFLDLLSGVNTYSTGIGRIWLAVLFIFRLLVYLVAAEHVWKAERREFECNVRQPGCANVCFDYFFPISQVRLWALQLIMVSTPSLLAVLHVACRGGREKQHRRQVCVGPGTAGGGLWCTRLISLAAKTGLELGFLVLFYRLYGGFRAPRLLKCDLRPCPSAVDCFVSKPTEKTVFTLLLAGTSCLCVVLNVTALSLLVLECFIKCCLQKHSTGLPASARERHSSGMSRALGRGPRPCSRDTPQTRPPAEPGRRAHAPLRHTRRDRGRARASLTQDLGFPGRQSVSTRMSLGRNP